VVKIHQKSFPKGKSHHDHGENISPGGSSREGKTAVAEGSGAD